MGCVASKSKAAPACHRPSFACEIKKPAGLRTAGSRTARKKRYNLSGNHVFHAQFEVGVAAVQLRVDQFAALFQQGEHRIF